MQQTIETPVLTSPVRKITRIDRARNAGLKLTVALKDGCTVTITISPGSAIQIEEQRK